MPEQKLFLYAFALLSVVSATAQEKENVFSLTVKLKAGYDPKPTVCILIRPGELFETVVTTGKTKTVFSGKLQEAKSGVFPLELDVSQGDNNRSIVDRLVYKLHLGTSTEYAEIGEMSNHPAGYGREVRLVHDICEGP